MWSMTKPTVDSYVFSYYAEGAGPESQLPGLHDVGITCDLWCLAHSLEDQWLLNLIIDHVYAQLREACWVVPKNFLETVMSLEGRASLRANSRLRRLMFAVSAYSATRGELQDLIKKSGANLADICGALVKHRNDRSGGFALPASDYYGQL